MTTAENWLDRTREDPLEPELPIIDPHHHFWNRPRNRYILDELLADLAGQNVRQTVFVECSSMYRAAGPEEFRVVGETEWVQEIAAQSASGGFGELPNQPASQPSHLLLDPVFRRGFAYLRVNGLSFEAWLYHPQLPELADLARAFPETVIILNHLGGPLGVGSYRGKRDEVFARWKTDLATVAACRNVVMKVGGIQMAINGYGWHERERPPTSDELLAANRDWYLYAIEQFGPERCMFESNFPPDKVGYGYNVMYNAFKRLSANYSASERAAMFHDTATRVYRPLV